MQYTLFQTQQPRQQNELPWLAIFPEWMPKVGGLAQMAAVILEGYGYCFGDPVRIIIIEGNDVVCRVEHQSDGSWWKNGKEYRCKLSDLWPNMYDDTW